MAKYQVKLWDSQSSGGRFPGSQPATPFNVERELPLEPSLYLHPLIQFIKLKGLIHCATFELQANVVPKWFVVACDPVLMNDFNFAHAHIYFHPTPGQAVDKKTKKVIYNDADYPGGGGPWSGLMRHYFVEAGSQVTLAPVRQVFIMPVLTEAAASSGTLGVFAADWEDICNSLLQEFQARYAPNGKFTGLTDVSISSFSAGLKYCSDFRKNGQGLSAKLREIIDLDGRYATYRNLLTGLASTPSRKVLIFDQGAFDARSAKQEAGLGHYHCHSDRWKLFASEAGRTGGDIHHLIARTMLYAGLWRLGGFSP